MTYSEAAIALGNVDVGLIGLSIVRRRVELEDCEEYVGF